MRLVVPYARMCADLRGIVIFSVFGLLGSQLVAPWIVKTVVATVAYPATEAVAWIKPKLAIEDDLPRRRQLIASIESCDHCGECEARCPYGLPVMDMLQEALGVDREVLSSLEAAYERCREV